MILYTMNILIFTLVINGLGCSDIVGVVVRIEMAILVN